MVLSVPGTLWDPLGARQTQPAMTAHDIVCIHTMAGRFTGTNAMFHENGYGGTESHLGTSGNGITKQWQDLMFTADANWQGNKRVISIENADMGENFREWTGSNVPPFTMQQVNELVYLLDTICDKKFHADCPSNWACHKYGIPRQLVANSSAGQRGIAYHRQGIDGDFKDGFLGRRGIGEKWSTGTGKPCPGHNRIVQLVQVIIPRVQAREVGEVDLTPGEHDALVAINTRSKAMYSALRNDDDADQSLVKGIRDHFRAVLDEESAESGSALRKAIGEVTLDRSKRALNEHPVAKASPVTS